MVVGRVARAGMSPSRVGFIVLGVLLTGGCHVLATIAFVVVARGVP
jgi:hypothetical protein